MANRKEIFGWQMYDWGWSAFSTTVTTALLAPYLLALAEDQGGVNVFGFVVAPESYFPFVVSLSAAIQVILLPLIGAVADHTPLKKQLLLGLAYVASLFTIALFAVTASTLLLGAVLFILASVGFSAASVVYNSFLPDIAPPELRDRVSSGGYAYGYLGGGLYLALNFIFISLMDDTELAVRLSLAGAGVWAIVFIAAFPQRLLVARAATATKPEGRGWLSFSVSSVWQIATTLRRRHPVTFRYLIAYLIYNDGIATVITIATAFAASELGADATTLLLIVLLIQFIAVPGAVASGRLAEQFGAKPALVANLAVWAGLVIYAYLQLDSIPKLWAMATVLAFVLGGSQALSRSLFSQMIPAAEEAEYFGFYEIAARGTSWIGPLVFAVVNQIVGSQRHAILSLIVFFVVGRLGLGLLLTVDVRKGMAEAGH